MKKSIKKIKNIYHYLIAYLSSVFYGNPSKNITVIAVSGTKGKTLTVELIAEAIKASGHKVATVSSVRVVVGNRECLNTTGNTMIGNGKAQKILAEAVKKGCKFAVLEVTSQGMIQHRHRFIEWDAVVYTNLHPEHIEALGGFENYKNTRIDFFKYIAKSPKPRKAYFINKEDEHAKDFIEAAGNNDKALFCGTFIKANYAAAIAVADYFGCDKNKTEEALNSFKGVPGRMETVIENPFKVIVDYAHTPDSLEQAYKCAMLPYKINHNNHKLICVLGSAGGGRDKWKRPKMGEIAARYCDEVIVTNEDPYDEDPWKIIESVAKGAKDAGKEPIKIFDRQEAINKAVSLSEKGDIVMITGKGSEQSIHFARGKKISWSEREAVLRAVKNRN